MEGRNGPERGASERVAVLECNYCRQRIVVIEEQRVGGRRGGGSGTQTAALTASPGDSAESRMITHRRRLLRVG